MSKKIVIDEQLKIGGIIVKPGQIVEVINFRDIEDIVDEEPYEDETSAKQLMKKGYSAPGKDYLIKQNKNHGVGLEGWAEYLNTLGKYNNAMKQKLQKEIADRRRTKTKSRLGIFYGVVKNKMVSGVPVDYVEYNYDDSPANEASPMNFEHMSTVLNMIVDTNRTFDFGKDGPNLMMIGSEDSLDYDDPDDLLIMDRLFSEFKVVKLRFDAVKRNSIMERFVFKYNFENKQGTMFKLMFNLELTKSNIIAYWVGSFETIDGYRGRINFGEDGEGEATCLWKAGGLFSLSDLVENIFNKAILNQYRFTVSPKYTNANNNERTFNKRVTRKDDALDKQEDDEY